MMQNKHRGQCRAAAHHGKPMGCGGGRPCHAGQGSTPVLTYFDVEGLAEQVRLTFAVGGVKFVDRRVKDHDEFAAKFKGYTPHGQLPILEVDGEMIVQSAAIMAYAARRAGLVPESPVERDQARSVQSMLVELLSVGDATSPSLPQEERLAAMKARMDTMWPTIAGRIEATINPSANGWLFGDTISYADIALHCTVRLLNYFDPGAAEKWIEQYPRITSVYNAVANHPAVRKYKEEQSPFKPKLYYFNVDGLAAPIRWALELGGVEYEDIRMTSDDWAAMKAKIPSGTVPALEIAEGEFLTESLAILVHVSRRSGLIPWRETQFAHAYSVGLTVVPISPILKSIYGASSEEEKAQNLKIVSEETMPALLRRLEAIVGLKQSKQGYIVGDKLSFADLLVANVWNMVGARHFGIVIKDVWTAYPKCKKVYDLVINHPVVADYLLRTPVVTPKLTYFDIGARAEAIRQIFKYGNIDFEDTRIAAKDWAETYKASALTGKCPYLDIGTDRIYETVACVMYAAERAHLVPRTWKARSQAMALYSVYNNTVDVRSRAYAAAPGPDRDALREANKPDFETQFAIVEKVLAVSQSTEGYAVGNELSWIDFYIAYETDFVSGAAGWLPENWTEKFPHVAKLHKLVLELRK